MAETERTCDLPGLDPAAYASWRASEIGAITEGIERRLILELAGDVSGRRVLDVGCGDGALAVELSQRGAAVAGIDSSPAMIDAAKLLAERRRVGIDFRTATAERLPYPAEQFDIVVAVTILCFVEDASSVFREMARVLRPGGSLVIGELGKWSSWAAARRIRGWLGSPLWRKGRFRTARELEELARHAGLVPHTVRGAVYYPRGGLSARLLAPFDQCLGRLTTIGAAFLALRATRPAPRN